MSHRTVRKLSGDVRYSKSSPTPTGSASRVPQMQHWAASSASDRVPGSGRSDRARRRVGERVAESGPIAVMTRWYRCADVTLPDAGTRRPALGDSAQERGDRGGDPLARVPVAVRRRLVGQPRVHGPEIAGPGAARARRSTRRARTSSANVPITSGRSVDARTTSTGRFTMLASSWTPPESETRNALSRASPRNSRYPIGATTCTDPAASDPDASRRAAVRGCIGSSTGSGSALSSERMMRSRSSSSTFSGRWNVESTNASRSRPKRVEQRRRARRHRAASVRAASTTVLPVTTTRAPVMPSAASCAPAGLGRRAAEIREVVGDHAVVLFGHRAVVAAQPGFDVHERDAARVRGERAGERAVRVALHHDDVRARVGERAVEQRRSRRRAGCRATRHRSRAGSAGGSRPSSASNASESAGS